MIHYVWRQRNKKKQEGQHAPIKTFMIFFFLPSTPYPEALASLLQLLSPGALWVGARAGLLSPQTSGGSGRRPAQQQLAPATQPGGPPWPGGE